MRKFILDHGDGAGIRDRPGRSGAKPDAGVERTAGGGRAEPKPVEQKPAETPKAVQTPAATEAPAYVARPAAVGTTTEAPKAETTKPVAEKATKTTNAEKPKRRRESTEARVIRELHRHGIYW